MDTSLGIFQDTNLLLRAIIMCLEQMIKEAGESVDVSPFDLQSAATVSIGEYMTRLFKFLSCSPSVFIYSLVLIDRLQESHPCLKIGKRNIHRMVVAALLVAVKYLDDFYFKNSYYSKVAGIPIPALAEMELSFLQLISFDVHVNHNTFKNYSTRLQQFARSFWLEKELQNSVIQHNKENVQMWKGMPSHRSKRTEPDSAHSP